MTWHGNNIYIVSDKKNPGVADTGSIGTAQAAVEGRKENGWEGPLGLSRTLEDQWEHRMLKRRFSQLYGMGQGLTWRVDGV